MLHASVRAVGEVAGGPGQIHLALKDALTTDGTLPAPEPAPGPGLSSLGSGSGSGSGVTSCPISRGITL